MKYYYLLTLICLTMSSLQAQFSEKKADMKKYEGFFDFWYDASEDKIYLETDDTEKEFLYVYSLSHGLGSNDIGLDRGQLGNEQVVYFKKAGNKMLLMQPNLRYRAITENRLERTSVEQAFAKTVLFGFEIKDTLDNGNFIIDFTPFLMQDMHGVAQRLKSGRQGNYSLDEKKSALWLERTRSFPENSEFEALLTFTGEPSGSYIRSVAPDPRKVSVVQHHSFVKLPDTTGFEMRPYDPRSGLNAFTYMDYATPVQESVVKRFIHRHRLEKKDPEAAVSEAVEPIVYYLDNGTPEPVRSALLEGAQWWNQAFEAAGYKNAFRVEILPDDADPLDVRYNVIQWVHRSTRGWSYGASVTDPRTGEIIKGHVSLGSLRIRQDFMIAQALLESPYPENEENYEDMLEIALARIRQLSAHEVGHTLGFAHNFAASSTERASVMDYPHPQYELDNGDIKFENIYDTGIGEWDKITVAYAYQDFPEGADEKQALDEILQRAKEKDIVFISDSDARSAGGAHALAHLWDNGKEATEELEEVLRIREKAIENFSEENIKIGEPYTVLEDVFVPLYFFHRYQTEATAKLVGGMTYEYSVRGGGDSRPEFLDSKMQKDALRAVLRTLDPEILAIPTEKLALFPPRARGYSRTRESFKSRLDVAFDPFSVAETAADFSLGFLLHPARVNRLVQQKSIDRDQLGAAEMFDELYKATFKNDERDEYLKEINQMVNFRVLHHLMNLALNNEAYPQVQGLALEQIDRIDAELKKDDNYPYRKAYLDRIERFREKPELFELIPVKKIPDGSPIGSSFMN
ncbi:zinc-dependent metalloprotease [Robertkochia aurantiaca]|uniref:zinc-dependent metalloprotease n=1 Tax=Robertkochia aurantiaca TaxID=2873700 RepID=UPI001CCBE27F|nr:zinc-dependent metalloprotease [Robertkochia sp. 3YJGBD-33]